MDKSSPLLPITALQRDTLELISTDFKENVSDEWYKFIKNINEVTYTNLLIKVSEILVKYTPIVEKILPKQYLYIEVYDYLGKYVIATNQNERNKFENFVNNAIVQKYYSNIPIGQYATIPIAYLELCVF